MFKLKKNLKLLFSLILAVVLSLGLFACGENENKNPSLADPNLTHSAVTESVKLDLNYLNSDGSSKDFVEDGIGLAKVMRIADGDTANFKLQSANGQQVTIRFYCIDTPESTGLMEKWGKPASNFTKEILGNAYEVVLESSTGGRAVTDSYGVRYLGYVWYRNSETDTFKNLNLLIVENGYSPNNSGINDKYYQSFVKAYNFASKNLLHLWGYKDDPYFSTDPQKVTLKDLVEDDETYWNYENESGAYVTIEAVIKSLYIGDSGTYNFTASQVVDGKEYTYAVYTGYASGTASPYLKIGNKYSMSGYVQYWEGSQSFQLSGLQYVLGQKGPGFTYILKSGVYLTFDSSIKYDSAYSRNLKSSATVTAAELNGTTLTLTVSAYDVSDEGLSDTANTYTITVEVAANFDVNTVLNKTMSGFVYLKEDGSSYYAVNYKDLSFN